jgi:hypothetical protein
MLRQSRRQTKEKIILSPCLGKGIFLIFWGILNNSIFKKAVYCEDN